MPAPHSAQNRAVSLAAAVPHEVQFRKTASPPRMSGLGASPCRHVASG